jgi:GDP-4-dehydro-6-deoxy-D-mannose reductase
VSTSHRPTVLVTGAAGFAGSHLLDLLGEDAVRVVALRKPGIGAATQAAYPAVDWIEIDMLDRESVRRTVAALAPATIYHLAGSPHVGQSWKAATETLSINVLGTHHLLDGLRAEGLHSRVVVPSSESTNPYAISKIATELAAARASRRDGIAVVVARSFNHIGPRQDPSFFASGVARQVALIEAGRIDPAIRVGNLDSQRDITDVRDTVRAYRALAERGTAGQAYNVCSGQAHTMRALLDGLVALAKVRVAVEPDPARFRPNDTPLLLGDPSRIRRDVGWQPMIPIEQTLRVLLDYWRQAV